MCRKIIWICLILLLTFFRSSYEIKVKKLSKNFESKINNLLFDLSLKKVKKLEDNSFTEYEKKKKGNFKIFNFQKENEYKIKIDNLKNEDEKKLYLFKNGSSVNLKNSNFATESSYFVHIKRNDPYLSKMNKIKEDKRNESTNNITNSFIQIRKLLSDDKELLKEYKNLMNTINDYLDKAKVYFITAISLDDLGDFYINNRHNENYNQDFKFYNHVTKRNIEDFHKYSLKALDFNSETKDEMRAKFFSLLLLKKDLKKKELYEKKLLHFKSKIVESQKITKEHNETCSKKMNDVFANLQYNLSYRYCWGNFCNLRECSSTDYYGKICCYLLNCLNNIMSSRYLSRIKNVINKDLDNNFITEVDVFLNSLKLEEIKKRNSQRNVKIHLIMLIEKIRDIKNDYVKQSNFAYTSFNKLVKLQNDSLNVSFSRWNISRELAPVPIEFKRVFHYLDWNEELRENFYHYKREFYILFYGL
ncbi:reticulocyte binding protein, putative [Plasmodium relictum]|uniref:Reticulocyte binding protein, putative n=1 Tax=Plasmodium relictum TaxID=85471 RepID=A0A1J1GNH2_PLARL|nr:reticulocyte binding protein, putative [Plasmodium relictum]CRG85238.1 reticulocyte binding protein, putative [Plasmodium relictum]